jgi:hypothetical protein
MSKLLSMSLPVGAYLGGWRHIGGGNFTADVADKVFRPTMILEGATDGEKWPFQTTVDVVDGPGRRDLVRAVTMLVPVENGKRLTDGCSMETLKALAEGAGLEVVEPGLWREHTDTPEHMGWYEMECAADGVRVFGLWNGDQLGWLPFVGLGCSSGPAFAPLPDGFDAKSARWRDAGFSVVTGTFV